MYANRKQWTLTGLRVEVEQETTPDKKNKFIRKIRVSGQLDETQKSRLLQIANVCPVHKMLEGTNIIETALF
jgi:putative redox protein